MGETASIHRMVTPKHLCPWGVKARDLLKRAGYTIDDHHLTSTEANENYKKTHGYDETPQIFIGDRRIGGYDDLRKFLGKGPDPKEGKTYQPVLAVFSVTFLMALSTCWTLYAEIPPIRVLELFVAFTMCVLGILKLQDLLSFATGFVQYDLVARHYVPYSYVYAAIETGAGILMIAGLATWAAAPAALIVSTIGAVSVIRAVYIEKRDLNCACVGGGSKVPLGFISLTENLMMMAMSVWMLAKHL
ncbi:MAG: glutaredoxin family protein [Verrucomicrobiaceae bacterium]|nr:MAG: glutaredoxin family protein [Verrucomicrobiaceae bacterium]